MWRTGLVLLQRSQGMDLCPGIYTYVSIRDGYMCLGQVIGIHVCILQMLNFYLYERNISLQFQNIDMVLLNTTHKRNKCLWVKLSAMYVAHTNYAKAEEKATT